MEKIILTLLIISGIFTYSGKFVTRFYDAQLSYAIFITSGILSYFIYKKNKYLGLLAGLCSVMFLKTYLLQQTPILELYEALLIGFVIFGVYYIVREFKFKEDMFKLFLIPAVLNIGLLLLQVFDHNAQRLFSVAGLSGFLGQPSISIGYSALMTPLFFKYFKIGIPFLLLTIILVKSWTALCIFVIGSLLWLYFTDKKLFKIFILGILVFLTGLFIFLFEFNKGSIFKGELRQRGSFWLGTLDGIKHNPILGWGMGSFEPVISKIPTRESVYFGWPFNYTDVPGQESIMNHPHNEILFNWWQFGIGWVILFGMFIWNTIKQFKKENYIAFSILLLAFVYMNMYFISIPVWIFIMTVLAVYDNQTQEAM